MIDSSTRPILVAYTGRTVRLIHFASGQGRAGTIPYCQYQTGGPLKSLEQLAAHAARYAIVPAGPFMDCTACAEIIARHRTWRPNHFPLVLPNLRWV